MNISTTVEAPFSFTKKQEYLEKMEIIKQKQLTLLEQRKVQNKEYADRTTLSLISDYKKEISEEKRKEQESIKNNSFYISKEPNFFLVIRIRSICNVPPKVKKILELFRLRRMNNAVLLKNNSSIRVMLQKVRNYICYGFIDIYMLRELIYKRGIGRINGKEVNISNEVLEDYFKGEIKCVEEVVNHLYGGSSMFKRVNNFLCPFTLSCPLKGFKGKKGKDYLQGGCAGFQYDKIGELVERMI
ncbi:ribosomal protein L7 [Hamiltosporidium magnivora]|uniref:Ribosomal protein L7 n=1 Tax=Hamiltosporidium magnivora TaxID=148818 RepID=A0A4Q9LKW2_9MICR|nr:ribosomal protein L7 [Hamiltosporidium magnivora]